MSTCCKRDEQGAAATRFPGFRIEELTAAATAAVRARDGHILDISHVIFTNGAVTLVLILAESHLAIHTWPEEDLVAVDLFTGGAIDADRVVAELITGPRLTGTRVQQVGRGTARCCPPRAGHTHGVPRPKGCATVTWRRRGAGYRGSRSPWPGWRRES